jgi:hypothetical protein
MEKRQRNMLGRRCERFNLGENMILGFDRCLENLANGNVPESPHVEAETPQDAETTKELE